MTTDHLAPLIEHESLVLGLHDIGAVQFGQFRLKSGDISPVYLDLRLLVSQPATLRRAARSMQALVAALTFDRIAAIPLAGLPIGVALSLSMEAPLIYPRLQEKAHGTGRFIEGLYEAGETALVVDDVISRGDSKLESLQLLEAAGLKVTDMIVVVDRQMGGVETLKARGYTVHCVLTLQEILDTLLSLQRISQDQHAQVSTWLEQVRASSSHDS
jgi:uridine monophosphate synthetase